jgi:hypothetical protein
MREANLLLTSAVRCYRLAGTTDGVRRCLEQLGLWAEAAAIHESAGRFAEAALLFERAERFTDAARCHHQARQLELEIRCLREAGQGTHAAWLLVHELGRAAEARQLIEGAAAASPAEAAALQVVRARCELAQRDAAGAARRLRGSLAALNELFPGTPWRCAVDWALAVCHELGRPDLGVLVLMAAPADDGGLADWYRFCRQAFGEVLPPPVPRRESQRHE